MVIDNCIIPAKVGHTREKGSHSFNYNVFYLCIHLNEIDKIAEKNWLFSHNRPNIFSFYSRDFLDFGHPTILENFQAWLAKESSDKKLDQLYLIAHPRTFGYSFNPISTFVYTIQGDSNWYCAIEVDNTFGEAKMFDIGQFDDSGVAQKTLPKKFYVSPFIPLDTEFTFRVVCQQNRIAINVISKRDQHIFLTASMSGAPIAFSETNLFRKLLSNPHVTAKVIGGIHYEAFRLLLKKIPFIKKKSDPNLQRKYYDRKHHSKYVS